MSAPVCNTCRRSGDGVLFPMTPKSTDWKGQRKTFGTICKDCDEFYAEAQAIGRSVINRPVAWPGTKEEAEANYRTHEFDHETLRCWNCDCKAGMTVSQWPCRAFVPRELVMTGTGKRIALN